MWPFALLPSFRCLNCSILSYRLLAPTIRLYSGGLENKYTDAEKEKIIQFINEADSNVISKYEITKARLKNFSTWKSNKGTIQTLSDMHLVDGFSERIAKKLFDSILNGPVDIDPKIANRIKGQILQPTLSPSDIKNCKTILTVYTSVSNVCWTLIDKETYKVLEWQYYGIDYPEAKKLQITDILDISWSITNILPKADIYVMKAEATTLRAAGSDPNNPKVIAVNLQQAQMVAMMVALINSRESRLDDEYEGLSNTSDQIKHKVYFLRPSLPYRLYGTLVGNEKVSTDQTVDMLLQNQDLTSKESCKVSEELINMFRAQNDLKKDMLGHCFLLSLTFMDLCIYKNEKRIATLLKKGGL